MEDGSSSEDSLTGTSRGHKRKLETIIEDDGDENESNLEMPSSKFKKGEEVPSPMMLLILMLNLMMKSITLMFNPQNLWRGHAITYKLRGNLKKNSIFVDIIQIKVELPPCYPIFDKLPCF